MNIGYNDGYYSTKGQKKQIKFFLDFHVKVFQNSRNIFILYLFYYVAIRNTRELRRMKDPTVSF